MKLSRIQLDEAEMNRRHFLKQSGGALASLLINKGLGQETAQQLARLIDKGGSQPVGILLAAYAPDYDSPLESIEASKQLLTTLTGVASRSKPRRLEGDGTVDYAVALDRDSLQSLLANDKFQLIDYGDGDLGIYDGSFEFAFTTDSDTRARFLHGKPISDIVRTAWEAIGRWVDGDYYASMGWLDEAPALMRLAKLHHLSPPEGLTSWSQFPEMLKAGSERWRQAQQRDTSHQVQQDRRLRTDLEGGMHQDYDEFLESIYRLYQLSE